jgi:methylated-DNA-[protein]-cysteine S-methyltransferase
MTTAVTTDGVLTGLHMSDQRHAPPPSAGDGADDPLLTAVGDQLAAYFSGSLRRFSLPLGLHGTDFQQRVWTELCEIPYGATISYGELARRVGSPRGGRAVGAANGRNPVAVIVPCHRVIAGDGSLGGYGGGTQRKSWLLALERNGRPPAP